MKRCIPILLALTTALPVFSQQSIFEQVDALFAEWDREDSPGCALAIVRDGRILYTKGYGMADLEHGVPISPQSVFYAGSVSKQFVATCMLLLQEEGKLDIDDDVRKYVPELPDYGHTIRLRHLLHHISGLRDYLDLLTIAGYDYLDYLPHERALEIIFRQKDLNFRPGTQYSYSNSGYLLLAEIVKRVSGQSLREYAQQRIFEPLGMTNSHFHDDLYHLVPNRAFGYQHNEEGRVQNLPMRFALVGSGGLYTTVEDLFRWDQNFYSNRLGQGGQALVDSLQSDGRLNSGESAGYAFALVNGSYRGLPTVGHTGSLGGYRAYYVRFPEQRFSVIILGNFAEFNPKERAERIADLLLGDLLAPAETPTTASRSARRSFNLYSDAVKGAAPGRYYSSELNTFATISTQDDNLLIQVGYAPAQTIDAYTNSLGGGDIRFQQTMDGTVEGFQLHAGQIREIGFERVE